MASYTITFLRHCADVVLNALRSLSLYVPLAGTSTMCLNLIPSSRLDRLLQDTFLKSLQSSLLPACPGLEKTVHSFAQEDFNFGRTLVF